MRSNIIRKQLNRLINQYVNIYDNNSKLFRFGFLSLLSDQGKFIIKKQKYHKGYDHYYLEETIIPFAQIDIILQNRIYLI